MNRYVQMTACLVTGLWLSFPSYATLDRRCEMVNAMLMTGPGTITRNDINPHPDVVGPFKKTLEMYSAEGIEPPPAKKILSPEEGFNQAWEARARQTPDIPEYKKPDNAITMKKMKNGTDPVFKVTIDGKDYAFREIGVYTDIRMGLAAAEMNAFMGLETVPGAKVAIVDGKLGVLAEFIKGAQLPRLDAKAQIKRMLESGRLDPRSYSDAKGFEFLVGNADADPKDVFVDKSGKVKTLDHNYSFTLLVPEYYKGEDASLGPVLPEKYTPHFVKMVTAIGRNGDAAKRKEFIELMEKHLSSDEISGVLFRLDIINTDIQTRGADAVFALAP